MDGIKSKERVQEHGEVFTPDSIVNDMIDLTDKELKGTVANTDEIRSVESLTQDELKKYIDTTYLEPACGNGNFLIRILDRKLQAVQLLPETEQEVWFIHALSSIYGIDIQGDNVQESKNRMLELIKNGSVKVLELKDTEVAPWHFKPITLSDELEKIVKLILDLNIQQGNFLTAENATGQNLIVTEYLWNEQNVKCNAVTLKGCENGTSVTMKTYPEVNYKELTKTLSASDISNSDIVGDDEEW
jgi:hypothetical protein